MGVRNLWRLFPKTKRIPTNQRLAIDTSIWLHYHKDIDIPAFKFCTIKRILKLLYAKNKPIFIFDGKIPILKTREAISRQQRRNDVRNLARKYLLKKTCNVCKLPFNMCEHATISKEENIKQADDQILKNIKNEKPEIWGRDYDDEELCALEEMDFMKKGNLEKLRILIALRNKKKQFLRLDKALTPDEFSDKQILNLKKQNRINEMIQDLENSNKMRVMSDCERFIEISNHRVISNNAKFTDKKSYIPNTTNSKKITKYKQNMSSKGGKQRTRLTKIDFGFSDEETPKVRHPEAFSIDDLFDDTFEAENDISDKREFKSTSNEKEFKSTSNEKEFKSTSNKKICTSTSGDKIYTDNSNKKLFTSTSNDKMSGLYFDLIDRNFEDKDQRCTLSNRTGISQNNFHSINPQNILFHEGDHEKKETGNLVILKSKSNYIISNANSNENFNKNLKNLSYTNQIFAEKDQTFENHQNSLSTNTEKNVPGISDDYEISTGSAPNHNQAQNITDKFLLESFIDIDIDSLSDSTDDSNTSNQEIMDQFQEFKNLHAFFLPNKISNNRVLSDSNSNMSPIHLDKQKNVDHYENPETIKRKKWCINNFFKSPINIEVFAPKLYHKSSKNISSKNDINHEVPEISKHNKPGHEISYKNSITTSEDKTHFSEKISCYSYNFCNQDVFQTNKEPFAQNIREETQNQPIKNKHHIGDGFITEKSDQERSSSICAHLNNSTLQSSYLKNTDDNEIHSKKLAASNHIFTNETSEPFIISTEHKSEIDLQTFGNVDYINVSENQKINSIEKTTSISSNQEQKALFLSQCKDTCGEDNSEAKVISKCELSLKSSNDLKTNKSENSSLKEFFDGSFCQSIPLQSHNINSNPNLQSLDINNIQDKVTKQLTENSDINNHQDIATQQPIMDFSVEKNNIIQNKVAQQHLNNLDIQNINNSQDTVSKQPITNFTIKNCEHEVTKEHSLISDTKNSNSHVSNAHYQINHIFGSALSTEIQNLTVLIKEIIEVFNLPYIDSTFEADSQCAYLNRKNLVDAVVTEDNDIFLYGGTKIYRNFFKRNKDIELFDITNLEDDITREDLIIMSSLMGSDYTEGKSGFGLKKSLQFIQRLKKIKDGTITERGFDGADDIKDILDEDLVSKLRDLYFNCPVKEIEYIEWKPFNYEKVSDYIETNEFTNNQRKEMMFLLQKIYKTDER